MPQLLNLRREIWNLWGGAVDEHHLTGTYLPNLRLSVVIGGYHKVISNESEHTEKNT